MPKKLTQEEYEQRVFNAVGNKYTVIGKYQGKTKPIALQCNLHNIIFSPNAECFMRGPDDVRASCPICIEENKKQQYSEQRVELECAYCGKKFTRPLSRLNNSKSGLYFCCREHKDLAQRIESGSQFTIMRPEHYGEVSNSINTYRKYAFQNYLHKCAVCGFDEDEDILEVHHINENRSNNDLENLIILCPICHRKLTSHKYILLNHSKIVKKE